MTPTETVREYFNALVAEDGDRVIALMACVSHYVKIGTEPEEWVEGPDGIVAYFRGVSTATADLRINTDRLAVEERGDVAWFNARQTWRVTWDGRPEVLRMRVTGVLERIADAWRFVQIHASVGEGPAEE